MAYKTKKTLLPLKDKVEFFKKTRSFRSKEGGNRFLCITQGDPSNEGDRKAGFPKIHSLQTKKKLPKNVQFSALVPNLKGLERALSCNIKTLPFFSACTNSFSQKNINCSVKKSFDIYKEVCKKALDEKLKVRGYLSVAFSCPYEGKIFPTRVTELVERMLDLGVYEVSVSDTVGTARPFEVENLLEKLF